MGDTMNKQEILALAAKEAAKIRPEDVPQDVYHINFCDPDNTFTVSFCKVRRDDGKLGWCEGVLLTAQSKLWHT